MEVVRYQPGEAIRWLETEADRMRREATQKGKSAVQGADMEGGIKQSVANVASAIFDFGKSAYAEIAHLRAKAGEYVLLEERLDVVNGTSIKSIKYADVKKILVAKDKATIHFSGHTVSIKPYAYLSAGPLKVPVGWTRNGMEVPYYLLLEELAARCGVDLEIA